MCGNHSIDLQIEVVGWFLYGSGFCWGYFRTGYSIVLISEAAIIKILLFFITVAISSWWFCRLLVCSFTIELLCVCFYFFCQHLFYRSIFRWFLPINVFFITNCFTSSRYFSLTSCRFSFVNLMAILLGAVL